MQKVIIRCGISSFGKIQLSVSKNKSIIWIYRWTLWTNSSQPTQFRRIVDFLPNFPKLTIQVYWRPGLSVSQQFGSDLNSDQKRRSGTITNTASWLRSPLRHLGYSRDNIQTLHKLFNCGGSRWGYILIYVWRNDNQNPQSRCGGCLLCYTEVFGWVPASQLFEFVNLHLLLPKPLHVLLDHCGYCTHHPAGFVIFALLALLCLFIILIFPILPIVGICNIPQNVCNSNTHLTKHFFVLTGRQSSVVSHYRIFLLLPNRCLCIWNTISSPPVSLST